MSGKGGPAQARRRERRAAERAARLTAKPESFDGLFDGIEGLAELVAEPEVATAAFEPVETPEVDEVVAPYESHAISETAPPAPITLTINFNGQTANSSTSVESVSVVADGAVVADGVPVGEVLPEENPSPDAPEIPEHDGVGDGMRWTGTITLEGSATDDGRIFAPGAVKWRELPLSLGAMFDTPHADVVTASPVIGRIDEIWRAGNLIMARGIFDNSDTGREVARMVGDGVLRGVSVDIAVARAEIAYRSDVLDEEGQWKGGDSPDDSEDGPNFLDILFGDSQDEVMFVVWDGTIGAVTICPFPAFADARIEVAKSLVSGANPLVWTQTLQAGFSVTGDDRQGETPADAPEALTDAPTASLAASGEATDVAVPLRPPLSWFDDPELDELTGLTVDEDGRISGHAAAWDVCHIGIPGVCVTAPVSNTAYSYFHLKEVEVGDGEFTRRISCGTITLDTGHADRRLGRTDATRHYDDTGTAVADVVCGEDEFGIWVAGALRTGVPDETVRKLRGSALSGDWRDVNGNLEMVALLAVNVPGFPIPRVRAELQASAAGFEVTALTAAGVFTPELVSRMEQAKLDALRDHANGEYDEIARSLDT